MKQNKLNLVRSLFSRTHAENNGTSSFKKLAIVACCSFFIAQTGQAAPSQVPLEAAFAVSPNIMFLLDSSGSMNNSFKNADGTSSTRIEVAKKAITSLIQQTKNVRFCLSKFNGQKGAYISKGMTCSSSTSNIEAFLAPDPGGIKASGWTPLSEAYYDMTRYFRGDQAYFGSFNNGSSNKFDSPIQYRCQTNAVIVVTDGEPTKDWDESSLPTDKWTDKANISHTLPNWDNVDNDDKTYRVDDPNYSDYYLDDLALYGNQRDLKSSGTDDAKVSWDKSDFPLQNLKTHTIGLQLDMDMLQDAADYGKGQYISANSADELIAAMQDAIVTSLERQGSGAGATQSDISLTINKNGDKFTNLYFTQYDTRDWSGDLMKIELTEVGTPGNLRLSATQKWSAADRLDARSYTSRIIFTPNEALNGLLDFTNSSANTSITSSSALMDKIIKNNPDKAKEIIEYVRGRTDLKPKKFRPRNTVLGDLINSRATFVKGRNFGYLDDASTADKDTYAQYVQNNRENRKPIIYVGGNDGMMHAFDEETGEEVFAFVPNRVLGKLNKLRSTAYTENHLYLVDGEFSIVDAKLDKGTGLEWSTVLASPLGGGRKGFFMLDITDPSASPADLRANLFKWEINEKTKNNSKKVYKRMGFIINPPKIVRFRIPESGGGYHDKWVIITGNGVHSEYNTKDIKDIKGAASVFIIDLDTGDLITELLLDDGLDSKDENKLYTAYANGNGITSVAAVDVDANTYIDRIYAADLKGQLWRYNYNEAGKPKTDDAEYIRQNLEAAYVKPGAVSVPIFAATGGEFNGTGTGLPQAITAELTVTAAPNTSGSRDGVMVFFGTGQFFDFTHLLDEVNDKVQTMYAFWDRGVSGAKAAWTDQDLPIKRDSLQEQTIKEITIDGKPIRKFDTYTDVNYVKNPSLLGWLMDMPLRGERITRKSVGLFEHMAFFTQSPISKTDPCIEGIDGWSMIAKKDTATPIDVTLVGSSTTSFLGTKQTGDSIHDPIFVELSDGQFVAPVIDTSSGQPVVTSAVQIQKDYSRASWKRLQF